PPAFELEDREDIVGRVCSVTYGKFHDKNKHPPRTSGRSALHRRNRLDASVEESRSQRSLQSFAFANVPARGGGNGQTFCKECPAWKKSFILFHASLLDRTVRVSQSCACGSGTRCHVVDIALL